MTDDAEESTSTSSSDARDLLVIYLRDHRAGAEAGLQLAQRCRRSHLDKGLDDMLTWLEQQIEDDRASLDRLMGQLDVEQAPLKTALGVVAERFGRLKSNGRLVRRSPLSDLVELEGLAAGVVAKRALWRSLIVAGVAASPGTAPSLEELVERASEQLARIETEHDALAGRVLGRS